MAKARPYKKRIFSKGPKRGRLRAFISSRRLRIDRAGCLANSALLSSVNDSGSQNRTASQLRAAIAVATKAGTAYRSPALNAPPRAGPMIKPRPKAAPIRPNPLARFSSSVTSVM